MEAGGLQEVANPAGLFLEDRDGEAAGSVIGACMEGNRPIMAEFQALVAKTPYGMPRRTAVGFDYNRVNMLLAILEKRFGLDFGIYDAYVNVVGGMKVNEPAADLAVAAALVSSYRNRPLPKGILVFGEVGLTGEVRRVSAPERRIMDGVNLGFSKFIVPDSKLQLPSVKAHECACQNHWSRRLRLCSVKDNIYRLVRYKKAQAGEQSALSCLYSGQSSYTG